jgi:TPR repeat protein
MKNLVKAISLSLLMGSTFLTTAMDSKNGESVALIKKVVKRACNLTETIELFENERWKEAYKNFKRIGNAGGIVGSAYITYMEEKEHVDPTIVHGHIVVEPIPQVGQTLSQQYLKASLAYMEPEIGNKVKKLAPLILNDNAHAVSVMYKLCRENETVFNLLLEEKGFNKKYKSPEDLFRFFKPLEKPTICWNCLDPNYLVYLHKSRKTSSVAKHFTETELKYFAENYEKNPHLLGKLARKLATITDTNAVKQPIFWAHMAVENGVGAFCGQLGKLFLDKMYSSWQARSQKRMQQTKQKTFIVPLKSDERDCLELSRYYVYHIPKDDLLDRKVLLRLIQNYGADYEKGTYGKPDKLKGFLFDQKAADLGSSTAQFDVAVKYWTGNGVEKDLRKALRYFKLSAKQNSKNRDAQFNLGLMYMNGDGVETDNEKALRYFKLAESNGDAEATQIVINLLHKIEKDIDSLKRYADQGDPVAQLKVAEWLIEKAYKAQSKTESDQYFQDARYYYELSAAQHNKWALINLGVMLYQGMGGEPDLSRARICFQQAGDLGVAQAQHNFAAMTYLGQGGDKDVKLAEKYYKRSANQGNFDSIISLKALQEEASLSIMKTKEMRSADEDVEITLPALDENNEGEPTDKVEEDLIKFEPSVSEKTDEKFLSSAIKNESIQALPDIASQEEETQRLIEKHQQEIRELRGKKLAQKRAAELSKQTLKMKGKVYQEMKLHDIKTAQTQTNKPKVAHDTVEFVKTIFSVKGAQKINAFSIQAARKAFADLGCEVSNKKGENSTKLKFIFEGKMEMKFKFHNPHELGEDLYDALKPYMKRFLESINKTPETVH